MHAHSDLQVLVLAEFFVQFDRTANGRLGIPQKYNCAPIAGWPENQLVTRFGARVLRALLYCLLKFSYQGFGTIHRQLGIPHHVNEQDMGHYDRLVRAWARSHLEILRRRLRLGRSCACRP